MFFKELGQLKFNKKEIEYLLINVIDKYSIFSLKNFWIFA